MYNVPKTISLTILLKEAIRDLPREKAYVLPRVSVTIDCRKIVKEKRRERERERERERKGESEDEMTEK